MMCLKNITFFFMHCMMSLKNLTFSHLLHDVSLYVTFFVHVLHDVSTKSHTFSLIMWCLLRVSHFLTYYKMSHTFLTSLHLLQNVSWTFTFPHLLHNIFHDIPRLIQEIFVRYLNLEPNFPLRAFILQHQNHFFFCFCFVFLKVTASTAFCPYTSKSLVQGFASEMFLLFLNNWSRFHYRVFYFFLMFLYQDIKCYQRGIRNHSEHLCSKTSILSLASLKSQRLYTERWHVTADFPFSLWEKMMK